MDVRFELSLQGGANPFPITPTQLRNAGQILAIEFRRELRVVAERLAEELRRMYRVHRRERIDGEPSLIDKIETALQWVVQYDRHGSIPDIAVGVLDLPRARAATTEQTGSGRTVSIFDLVEDGRKGLNHGSRWYGFLPIDYALELVDQCADQMGLDDGRRLELRQYVQDRMGGRHGEGIMVKLDEPVFFAYPDFGTALEHGIQPHAGFTSWNVYRDATPGFRNEVLAAMDRAVRAAALRIQSGGHRASPFR